MGLYCCPVCHEMLDFDKTGAFCSNGHRFDRARQGYINLLQSQSSSQKHHGDDKLMSIARNEFLSAGFYAPLLKKLTEILPNLLPQICAIADVGCGEGYYTQGVYQSLVENGKQVSLAAIDISKDIVKFAAKRLPKDSVVVASAYALPLEAGSCDLVMNLFAPVAGEEFFRVLTTNGYLLRALPREDHLMGLKRMIYEKPYRNPPVQQELENFSPVKRYNLDWTIHLQSQKEIESLFKMTPYYYKTSAEDQQRLAKVEALDTEVSFAILVDRKVR